MLDFVRRFGGNIYSQNGEDFLLKEILRRIQIPIGTCVEFGGANGTFCSNTANLIINQGWQGKMIEGEEMLFAELLNNPLLPEEVDCVNAFVTPENVNHLVPECEVLSIDVDGNDAPIWAALKKKPDVVIIEINSGIVPSVDSWDINNGASYAHMVRLGISKGYFLLCHTGNCIFLLDKYREKFPEIIGDALVNYDKYFNESWL